MELFLIPFINLSIAIFIVWLFRTILEKINSECAIHFFQRLKRFNTILQIIYFFVSFYMIKLAFDGDFAIEQFAIAFLIIYNLSFAIYLNSISRFEWKLVIYIINFFVSIILLFSWGFSGPWHVPMF